MCTNEPFDRGAEGLTYESTVKLRIVSNDQIADKCHIPKASCFPPPSITTVSTMLCKVSEGNKNALAQDP